MRPTKPKANLIPVDDYPQLLPKALRAPAMLILRSSETLTKADRIIAMRAAELRGAVLELIGQMEAAAQAGDWPAVYATAHEIRGLAGTAGLTATGRVANGFCHYLDTIALHRLKPDSAVTTLHVDAIARSARTEDDAARHGDAVAQQLSKLVARKLAEIKDSETPRT